MFESVYIAIDIGGTYLRIGAVNDEFKLIHNLCISSKAITVGPPETAVEDMAIFVQKYIDNNHFANVKALAIAFPGTLDKKRTIVYSASNLGENATSRFDMLPFKAELSKHFAFPVFLGKDTDFILRNDIYEFGIDTDELVTGIYFGTGIGCSMVYNGKSMYGADGVAGEIGHLPISETNYKCTCGYHGCCETVASGWRLNEICEEFFNDIPIGKIFTKFKKGNVIDTYLYDCARVIALTINLLNSDYTIVGGGIPAMEAFPKDVLRSYVLEILRHPYPSDTFKLLFSTSSQMAGVVGGGIYSKALLEE